MLKARSGFEVVTRIFCSSVIFIALGLMGWKSSFGQTWTNFTSMNEINDLVVQDGAIWGATNGGVFKFDLAKEEFTAQYTNLDGLAGNRVLSIDVDDRGNIWFGTAGNGLSRFSLESERFEETIKDFEGVRVNAIFSYQNKLFVGTEQGISVFLPDKEEIKENYRQLGRLEKDPEILFLSVLLGKLWAGSEEGFAWADLTKPNLKDPLSWKSRNINSRDAVLIDSTVFVSGKKSIWTVTEVSVVGTRYKVLTIPGLSDPRDRSNLIGVYSAAGSLVAVASRRQYSVAGVTFSRMTKIFEKSEDVWTEGTQLNGVEATAFAVGPDGALWLGTKGNGLLKFVFGVESRTFVPNGPDLNHFTDLTIDQDGSLWACSDEKDLTLNGIRRFDGRNWVQFLDNLRGAQRAIVAVEVDKENNIWAGSWGGGVTVVTNKGQKVARFDESNSILRPFRPGSPEFVVTNDIISDNVGNIWILNFNVGLAVFESLSGGRHALYTPLDGIPDPQSELRSIDIALDNIKWIGTFTSGIFLFDDGGTPFEKGDEVFIVFNTATNPDDIPSNKISDIKVDRLGTVWVGTDNGVSAITGSYSRVQKQFAVDPRKTRVYTTDDGLPSNAINVIEVDGKNNKWIGTDGGLVQIPADGGSPIVFNTSNSGIVDNRVKSLIFNDKTGELFIGTLGGVSKLRTLGGKEMTVQVKVFPNPFIVGRSGRVLTFEGLAGGSQIEIFTSSGQVVRSIGVQGPLGEDVTWDGLNESGFFVGSGVYFFTVTDTEGNFVTGKIAVIRTL